MGAVLVVAAVIGIFFLTGLLVGVVVMIALSFRKASRAEHQRRVAGTPLGRRPRHDETDPDDDEPDGPPWWQSRAGY